MLTDRKGFRRFRSTNDCKNTVTTDNQRTFAKNVYLSVVFIDISSTYDIFHLEIIQTGKTFEPPIFSKMTGNKILK